MTSAGGLLQFHSVAPDERGRRMFTLFWLASYHPGHPKGENRVAWRGQVFFADPAPYLANSYVITDVAP